MSKARYSRLRPFTKFVRTKFGNHSLIGAEVGVQRGDNALTLLSFLNFSLSQLYLIDIWDSYTVLQTGGRQRISNSAIYFSKVMERFGDREDVSIIRLPSIEAAKGFSDYYFDFIYLDAQHDYEGICQDIRVWYPKVKMGGVLGGHDFLLDRYPGVVRAVEEFVSSFGLKLFQAELDWWCVKQS